MPVPKRHSTEINSKVTSNEVSINGDGNISLDIIKHLNEEVKVIVEEKDGGLDSLEI